MAQTKEESKSVNKKRKREKVPIEKLPPADSGYNCKFARALGSVDWHTREQGLQALTIWLTRNEVSDHDLTKIWKALFFCFWHADKAPVQVRCGGCCILTFFAIRAHTSGAVHCPYVNLTTVLDCRTSLQSVLPPSFQS